MNSKQARCELNKQIARATREFPSLRLGQLLDNAISEHYAGVDLYYATDEMLATAVRQYVIRHGKTV